MKILFAGDMAFARMPQFPGAAKVEATLRDIKPVFDGADFSVVNLECVLYDGNQAYIEKSGPALKAESRFVDYLNCLGVDLAGLANNHTGDFREEALFDTMALLEKNNIAHIGAGANVDEAYKAHIFEKDGLAVSVIAVCENEFGTAGPDKAGTAGLNVRKLKNRIGEEKQKADFVVLFFHGGNERNPFPSPGKTDLYRDAVDFGADAVVAMHTHCPQGYEIYREKPIFYSLGNFFFPTPLDRVYDPHSPWYYGYMAMLDFSRGGIGVELHPYEFGTVLDDMVLLQGEKREKFIAYLEELSKPLADPGEIDRLFSVWSTISGEGYATRLVFNDDMKFAHSEDTCHLRNLFGCEAHNEMITRLTELCYRGEFPKYKAMEGDIIRYQHIP